jgi:hypothetical protein
LQTQFSKSVNIDNRITERISLQIGDRLIPFLARSDIAALKPIAARCKLCIHLEHASHLISELGGAFVPVRL